ncbi:hypothetical protein [Aquicoccus porphyridii]|uniref:hypothetical protein n=1 Tax=Aquicoccus porphyridii TaxID=1852029 RepID=UPI00273DE42A|nr:hypothetical protein [Aquicoccus porphyridii]
MPEVESAGENGGGRGPFDAHPVGRALPTALRSGTVKTTHPKARHRLPQYAMRCLLDMDPVVTCETLRLNTSLRPMGIRWAFDGHSMGDFRA